MCSKCRATVRDKATDHYMDTHNIAPLMRKAFKEGARFGELQAALFVERIRKTHAEGAGAADTAAQMLSEMLGVDVTIIGGQPAREPSAQDKLVLEVLDEVVICMEAEALDIVYGRVTVAAANNYNSLREVHQLPPKTLQTTN